MRFARQESLACPIAAEGTEVEVTARWPRGSGGARHRVRSPWNGVDGWIAVANHDVRSESGESTVRAVPRSR